MPFMLDRVLLIMIHLNVHMQLTTWVADVLLQGTTGMRVLRRCPGAWSPVVASDS